MKITDMTLTMFNWGGGHAQYGTTNPLVNKSQIGLVTISTDEGVTGHSFLGASYRSAEIEAWSMINILKPILVGKDPFDRSAIYEAMTKRIVATSFRAIGSIDIALWDLAGKVAGLPVHKLIGTYKHSVPVYASSPTLKTDEAYVDLALKVKDEGYVGYKTHPPPHYTADQNIALHRKIRDAVGPEYRLMVDSAAHLDYGHALKLGYALKEMDYYWFEDPLPHTDIWSYVKLCEKMEIPVMATEYQPGGFHFYAPWITMHATYYLRGDVAVKGGITPCLMTGMLAHGFHMNYEIHHGGNSANNIANLHLIQALPNSEMFEVLLPGEAHKFGVLNDLDIDAKGHVTAPDGPGLGVEYDLEAIKKLTVGVLR